MKIIQEDVEQLTLYMEKLIFQLQETEDDHRNKCCASQDLSLHEIQIIVYLGQNGASKMKDIGSHVSVSLSNLTLIVDKLEEKGLAERIRSTEDRRIVMVHLAKGGQDVFDTHHELKLEMSKNMLKKLTEDERRSYIQLMQKITDNP